MSSSSSSSSSIDLARSWIESYEHVLIVGGAGLSIYYDDDPAGKTPPPPPKRLRLRGGF
jgi:hypothetical protein